MKLLARRCREEEKFIHTTDKGSLETLWNTFGGSGSVDSEAQTHQVLSQSPVWLKIKAKEATGKKNLTLLNFLLPFPHKEHSKISSVHLNLGFREDQSMAMLGTEDP